MTSFEDFDSIDNKPEGRITKVNSIDGGREDNNVEADDGSIQTADAIGGESIVGHEGASITGEGDDASLA